jgi:hypothetical protein
MYMLCLSFLSRSDTTLSTIVIGPIPGDFSFLQPPRAIQATPFTLLYEQALFVFAEIFHLSSSQPLLHFAMPMPVLMIFRNPKPHAKSAPIENNLSKPRS